jgi:hypothetical protein
MTRAPSPAKNNERRNDMTQNGEPLINIEGLTKIFYTDEIETHAL